MVAAGGSPVPLPQNWALHPLAFFAKKGAHKSQSPRSAIFALIANLEYAEKFLLTDGYRFVVAYR
jgi:hypothetical protein